jgi:hypothetical protein
MSDSDTPSVVQPVRVSPDTPEKSHDAGRAQRPVATIPTGEVIDRYGRMLPYLAPWFSGGASDPLPPWDDAARPTFNLDMVAGGWAAPFMVFPSLRGDSPAHAGGGGDGRVTCPHA